MPVTIAWRGSRARFYRSCGSDSAVRVGGELASDSGGAVDTSALLAPGARHGWFGTFHASREIAASRSSLGRRALRCWGGRLARGWPGRTSWLRCGPSGSSAPKNPGLGGFSLRWIGSWRTWSWPRFGGLTAECPLDTSWSLAPSYGRPRRRAISARAKLATSLRNAGRWGRGRGSSGAGRVTHRGLLFLWASRCLAGGASSGPGGELLLRSFLDLLRRPLLRGFF